MTTECPRCGGPLARESRSALERIFLRRIDACRRCGRRVRTLRVPLGNASQFLFSRYTHCIQCGTWKVRRLAGRDHIDGLSMHPLSLLFGLTRAPYVHCSACRLQYHDWRRPEPRAEARENGPAGTTPIAKA